MELIMTNINSGTQSTDYTLYKEKKSQDNVGVTSSDASILFDSLNNNQKKYFTKTNSKTRKITNKNFINFVAELMNVTNSDSSQMILDGYVSVNDNIVSDTTYELKIGDVVRNGVGHVLVNSNYIAIVS